MQRRYSLVLFSLFLLAPCLCFGQEPLNKSLSGYIRDESSGHVIGEARIELQSTMGTPIAFAYSDGNGAYEFDNINGDCYLSVQHDGYTPSRELVRFEGSGHVYKDVLLRMESRESAPKSVNPVSQHQLSIPPKARESFEKGIQLIAEKSDYRGALVQFSRAVNKYPSYYEAYAAMGLAQARMGDAEAAEASFRKSIALSAEKYPQAMTDLASMFNGQKRFSDAEPLLRKAIALDASSWRGQFELSVALSGQNRFSEALTSASAARDLKPDTPQIYLLLYNLHIHTNDLPAALRDTEGYLKLAPDGATADRVRRMQEQVQKAVQATGNNPGPSSDATPASPVESPVDGAGAAPVASPASEPNDVSNFTPVDAPTLASGAGPAAPAAMPATAPAPSPVVASSAPTVSPALASAEGPAPQPAAPSVSATVAASEEAPEPIPAGSPNRNSVIPPRVDESVPEVAVDVPCSLSTVLQGAGRRAEQLLNSLQKFDASERVEHYKLNAAGMPGAADVRSFDYVVSVSHDSQGGFELQEYRNGQIVSPSQFPSGIVTANLSAHALIFHPSLVPHFNFTCEGLGEWRDRPTWQVRFEEKPHQLDSFRSYVIEGFQYPILLTGRAWIDTRTYQVLHLESDLLKPVEKIHLTREHISIEYAAVQFHSRHQQLWLPQTADLYVEMNGHRFYRRHTFSNFKIFSTDTIQEVHAPKQSYCFTNTSNLLITGVLNATPVSGKAVKPVSLTLTIPANSTVCKTVGAGKDLNIPIEFLASSSFAYDGPAGSVEADSYLPTGGAPEVIPNRNVPSRSTPD